MTTSPTPSLKTMWRSVKTERHGIFYAADSNHTIQGREANAVTECAGQVARAVHQSFGGPLERIRVTVTEVPASHWMVGDRSKVELDVAAATARDSTGGEQARQP